MKVRSSFIAKSINKVFRLYWFFRRPKTRGVKALIFNNKNQVLMVRLTYYPNTWTFPGGGVNRNEKPEEAALRECKEEIGIEPLNLAYISVLDFKHEYKQDTLFVYKANAQNNNIEIDRKEIAEADWFDLDNLPAMGKNAKKILETLN